MTEITKVDTESTNQDQAISVWQRPVFGENSLVQDLLGKFQKLEVSENSVSLHNKQLLDIRVFAKTAEAIDNDKFGNQEFLLFVKIKYMLLKGVNEYAGLYESMTLLRVAIEAKESFFAIAQTELRFRGSKQQQFYRFVEQLLVDHANHTSFRQNIQVQLSEMIPQVKTEEGKKALNSYIKHLEKVSERELGLKLLSLFKNYQLADYSILQVIADMIQSLDKKDIRDFKSLLSLVMANYNVFQQIRKIIDLPDYRNTPETYALMIQYLALSHKHGLVYLKFDKLVRVLRKWFKPYQAAMAIRQEYPPKEYHQPKEFTEPIPGVEVYEKYKKWLTDKKSGMTYIDFGE